MNFSHISLGLDKVCPIVTVRLQVLLLFCLLNVVHLSANNDHFAYQWTDTAALSSRFGPETEVSVVPAGNWNLGISAFVQEDGAELSLTALVQSSHDDIPAGTHLARLYLVDPSGPRATYELYKTGGSVLVSIPDL